MIHDLLVTGNLIFNISHFTNYTTIGNSQLEIWDDTDEDKNNLTKYINDEPVLKELKMYDLPYLKDEVRALIMWLKENTVC